jgi:tRNA splicing endonuclease
MGRPRRVIFEKFSEYNKLHTQKSKMFCGVEQTTLYPIKETAEFYQSIEVWAYCASKFRSKKKNITLNVDIPIIKDEKTIDFLNSNCWKEWVNKEIKNGDSDIIEAISLLDRVFPKHEKVFFYELDSLISLYIQGSLISFDDDGNLEPREETHLKRIEYYIQKYLMLEGNIPKEILKYREDWRNYKGDDKNESSRLLGIFFKKRNKWALENLNFIDIFIEVGRNSVCYPVAFSKGTGMWAKEKYGKPTSYSNAGEIFFVATKDKVFFEIKRHF